MGSQGERKFDPQCEPAVNQEDTMPLVCKSQFLPHFTVLSSWDLGQIQEIWRKRVGVESAMILQIASVYAALPLTRSGQSLRYNA